MPPLAKMVYTPLYIVMEAVKCCRFLTVSKPSGLAYHSSVVVDVRPGTDAVWSGAAFRFVTLRQVQLFHGAERAVA